MVIFMWIGKKGFSASHPASFFAMAFTFTLVGYYLSNTLNVESFILLVVWTTVALSIWNWLKNKPQADKQVFRLLSVQFIALAFIIPAFLHYANVDLVTQRDLKPTPHHEKVNSHHEMKSAHETTVSEIKMAPAKSAHSPESAHHHAASASSTFNQQLVCFLQRAIFIFSLVVAFVAWRAGNEQVTN